MNIDPDILEEIKEMLEHGLDRHSWPSVEDALALLKEELGYKDLADEKRNDSLEEE